MTEELKTIREIYLPSDGCSCPKFIKAEAIKWVKALEQYEVPVLIGHDSFNEDGITHVTNINVIRLNKPQEDIEGHHIRAWIKHFFNITGEELK